MVLAVIPGKALAGALWSFLAGIPPRVIAFLSGYLVLNVFTKICMPPRGCLPNACPMGAEDSRVTSLRRCGASCHGKDLAGLAKAVPRQGPCRGVCFVPFALCGLGIVLLLFSFSLTLVYLPCRARY